MATTRLGLDGGPRAPYGSFAGKTEESGGAQNEIPPKLLKLDGQFATNIGARLGGNLE